MTMTREPAYITQGNIQHYESLLRDPTITAVTRDTVTKLLREARAMLGSGLITSSR